MAASLLCVGADVFEPLPPGAVKLSGGLAEPIAKSIEHWHKGNVPYHEFAKFFQGGRPKFALGEMWGKFVRSGAMQYRHSPDPDLKKILDSAVKDILATERANGSISCVPVERQPAGVDGVTKPDCGDLWERKYVMLGLEDYYEWVVRDPAVLSSLERQAACIMDQIGPAPKMDVRDAGWSANHVESSTLLEPFMRLHSLTGNGKYLDFAKYLVDCGGARGIDLVQKAYDNVPPHLMGGTYPKAYETTSYFEGLVEYFRATGDERVKRAILNYFNLVLERELTIVGNGGGDQPYHPKVMGEAWDNTAAEQTNPNMKRMMETCTGVTWMKYASQILRLTGDARAMDAIERYVYNGLLGAMKPEGDGFSYVNLLNGEKVTNKGWGWKFPSGPVTCCNLNGPMGLAYIPFVAVMQGGDGPVVNLYNAGTATAATPSGGKVRLVAEGDLVAADGWRMAVKPSGEENFTISLRIPSWSERTEVRVNGESAGRAEPGKYFGIKRVWRGGDKVSVAFDFRARRLEAPHGSNRAGDGYQAVVWGPIALARDENTDPSYAEPVNVKADENGFVAVRRVPPTHKGRWLEFRVPTESGEIAMCDYASVDGWKGKKIQTWLPKSVSRTVEDFNDGWEFSRDRKTWRAVEIPHDWAIEGPFEPEGNPHTGKLPWKGVGYYRRNLMLDAAPNGRRVFLDFDGVMCDGTAYVNDQPCGRQMYGYLGFRADATPYLHAGTNTIMVKADTTKLASRWYPGAGMYRRVRKIETGDLYLDERDVAVTTPDVGEKRATVRVHGFVTSRKMRDVGVRVIVRVLAPSGDVAATAESRINAPKCAKGEFDVSLAVDNPVRWEMASPAALYTTEICVKGDGSEDAISFKTGFRTFRFDARKGFFLNGRHVQLKGVCLHADLGILGMAYNRSAMRRQLAIMRDMGVNALRTSHNPPSPETLELCDEMGIFVWNECFDKWNSTCGRGDEPLEEFVSARLAEFTRRDRNHPCVFVWSIGNEIPNGGGFAPGQDIWNMPRTIGTTLERCTRFRNAVLAEDATRPVGIGSCFPAAATEGHYATLDITGWNYRQLYDEMHRLYPGKPLIYSESASAFSDYGYYAPTPPTNRTDYAIADLSVDSYDHNAAAWSDIPDREFERMERDKFVAGEFVWTGIDYLGEPSPYARCDFGNGVEIPKRDLARSSYFGICDLLCFPKDRTYLYRSYWNKESFTLHIVPDHWTFPERVGRKMPVYVYTSADEAELFQNGASLGRRRKDPSATMKHGYYGGLPRYRLVWNDVEWKPGTLKAIAYGPAKAGSAQPPVIGEETLRTAGAAASVVLAPESDTLPNDGRTLVFVRVTLADANGTPVPRDNRRVSFSVEGAGEIVSVGNSDPRGLDSFKDVASHPLHNGRAGLAIRRTGPGEIKLTASADGLAPAVVTFAK